MHEVSVKPQLARLLEPITTNRKRHPALGYFRHDTIHPPGRKITSLSRYGLTLATC